MLATKFGRNSSVLNGGTDPLTNDQMFKIAPSIFAEEKHGSRSERYTYIPTIDVLEGLKKEGFDPFFVAQSKSRIEGKSEFTKHMIRLRHQNNLINEEVQEIILINSHDGTSSYQMLAGCFRFVCTNGMVTGDIVEDIRVKHRGNIVHDVIDAAYTIVDGFGEVQGSINDMKSIDLKPREAEIFAKAALGLKYDDDKAPIEADKLLIPHRWEDRENKSIWTNFNVIQENLIRGGQRGRSSNGNRTTTRAVQSIDNNVKLNRSLWILADEMARLKA